MAGAGGDGDHGVAGVDDEVGGLGQGGVVHVLVGGGDEDAVVTLDVLGGEGDGFAPGEMGVLAGLADNRKVRRRGNPPLRRPLVERKILFLPHPSSSSFRVYENIMQCIAMAFLGARFTWFRFFVIV